MGLLLQATNISALNEIVESISILTCAKFTTDLVKTHYQKLKHKVEQTNQDSPEGSLLDDDTLEEDFHSESQLGNESDNMNITQDEYISKAPNSPFNIHFQEIVKNAIAKVNINMLNKDRSTLTNNAYYGKDFINYLLEFSLPNIPNWSSLMIFDLGRHGTSQTYATFSDMYKSLQKSKFQNITSDNRTQGIIEKSMGEVKRTKLANNRCRRLDEFVLIYERDMLPLHREFCEAFCKTKNKRINAKSIKLSSETWSKRVRNNNPNNKGVYLTPPSKGLIFKPMAREKRKRKPIITLDSSSEESIKPKKQKNMPQK